MLDTSPAHHRHLVPHVAFMAVSCVAITAALMLSPDPQGFGTHQQLGLPACGIQRIFGIPGPLCGYTTAFVLQVHGSFLSGFRVQPMGSVLFWIMIIMDVVIMRAQYEGWNFFAWLESHINKQHITLILIAVVLSWMAKLWL